MTRLPSYVVAGRLFQLLLALIPFFLGALGFVNSLRMKEHTLNSVIKPMLTMQERGLEFSLRAIHSDVAAQLLFYGMSFAEGLAGLLALWGIVRMLRSFCRDHDEFCRAHAWARAACVWGFLVWGLGFYTLAGDYFLSWQVTTLGMLQSKGFDYAIIMAVTYLLLKAHERSETV